MIDITEHVTDRFVGTPSHGATDRVVIVAATDPPSDYFRTAYFRAEYFSGRYFRGADVSGGFDVLASDRVTDVAPLVWS